MNLTFSYFICFLGPEVETHEIFQLFFNINDFDKGPNNEISEPF